MIRPSGSRSVTLGQVARHLRARGFAAELGGSEETELTGVSSDSRTVVPGDLFLAWEGTTFDAHDFVPQAAERGAAGALVTRLIETHPTLPQLRVDHGREEAAHAAMLLFGEPAEGMRVTAVTGTNGKTTVAFLVRRLLAAAGPAAALGTLGVVGPDGRVREGTGGLTTPGPVEVALRMRELADAGVREIVLEASSHAIEQRRLDGVPVAAALFTNLSRDHLDYHATMEEYLRAKARLLELLQGDADVVVYAGDPAWRDLPRVPGRLRVVRFAGEPAPGIPDSAERLPDLVVESVSLSGEGADIVLRAGDTGDDVALRLPLLGRFNVENAAVAAAAALAAGLDLADIADGLSRVTPPAGRMEITTLDPVPVILDYAHTPDALFRALETLRPLYEGRLIVVFGAGGDRDRTKRPAMGRVATDGADLAIVTSDNPRTEDPDAIIDDVVAGIPSGREWERVTDRREAIGHALRIARPGDAVLLAGKGHETYQVVGTETRPFDERDVVRELLTSGAVG